MSYLMEEFFNYYVKGKGKGNSKGKTWSKNKGNVNAYAMDSFDFHGPQFDQEGEINMGNMETETVELPALPVPSHPSNDWWRLWLTWTRVLQ